MRNTCIYFLHNDKDLTLAKHIYHESVHSSQTILSAAAVHKAVITCEIWLAGTASDYLPLIIIENLWIWFTCYWIYQLIGFSVLFQEIYHQNIVYSNIIYSNDCLFVLSFWHLQINDCLTYFNTLYPFPIAVHVMVKIMRK